MVQACMSYGGRENHWKGFRKGMQGADGTLYEVDHVKCELKV